MRFIIYVIDGSNNTATGTEMQDIDAFNEKLEANGHFIFAAGIGDRSTATLIDNRLGAGLTDGASLQPGPEHYSGFWLIKADSLEQAKELAAEGSRCCNRRVELRPFLGQ
jgi:hypothetical protein